MFKKVLIANRGEIAVRVIRACREMGVATVAVYSDVDRSALHVRYADEAYCIGPAPARESYLRGETIIAVAKQAGAEAIHPGYGFLAENADFAQACRDAGLVFIGPTPAALRALGDKAAARRTMRAAGLPVVPGVEDVGDLAAAREAAEAIGYPLLVKAVAGGGGRGVREVHTPAELPSAWQAAAAEAQAAFGNGTLYLEKLVEGARHIEFQLLGDGEGHLIHLGERECSIQRRHQKLIEEAPSRALDDDLRQRMGEMAVQAARAAGYSSVGTVEFLLDREKNFYFLETNTRLQVEHPVTELVTGIDLVKEQIRLAAGRRLRLRQEDVRVNGWAMECRICAEDPFHNFLPSVGRVSAVYEPAGPGVRLESGVYAGFTVSLYYDPLIAKLAAWGETRGEAILRLRRALREYRIIGIQTNIPLHLRILDSPRFVAGQFDTTFVESRFALSADEAPSRPPFWEVRRDGASEEGQGQRQAAAIAAAILAYQKRQAALAGAPVRGLPETSPWKDAGRRQGLRSG